MRTCLRGSSLALALLIILIGAASRVSGDGVAFQQPDMVDRLDRMEQWLKAVMRHEPGTTDDAAGLVGSWSNSELRQLWIDTNVMAQLMRNPRGVGFSVRSEGQRVSQKISYTVAQFRHLKALACAAGGMVDQPECLAIKASISVGADLLHLASLAGAAKRRGDDNYVLRRGALLHADIAMLVGEGTEPVSTRRTPGPERIRMNISDGLEIEVGQVAIHWEIARMLLDYVKPHGADRPAPGRDEMVRQWDRATAAWMQMTESHDTLHLDRAREVFPADPDLLFLSGCQRESVRRRPDSKRSSNRRPSNRRAARHRIGRGGAASGGDLPQSRGESESGHARGAPALRARLIVAQSPRRGGERAAPGTRIDGGPVAAGPTASCFSVPRKKHLGISTRHATRTLKPRRSVRRRNHRGSRSVLSPDAEVIVPRRSVK